MDKKLLEVATKGTYYNPANSHYGNKDIVICDRCQMADIKVSIGYEDLDLCLVCTHVLVDMNTKPTKSAKPLQEECTESSESESGMRMRQQMYRETKKPVTKMKQAMYDSESSESEPEVKPSSGTIKMMAQRMFKKPSKSKK